MYKRLIIFFFVIFLFIFGVVEIFFQYSVIPMQRADKDLVFVPNPKFPGHDRFGFRNDSTPEEADIVCLGDSQTYGIGAMRASQAWPQQLGYLSGKKVYNMAFGGYGPLQELMLLPRALAFKPKIVIAALYLGNDLYDSYSFVYKYNKLIQWKSGGDVAEACLKADRKRPLEQEIDRYFFATKNRFSIWIKKFTQKYMLSINFIAAKFFHLHKNEDEFSFYRQRSKYFDVYENGAISTVFTPGYRFIVEDLSDVRINEGFRISMSSLKEMSQICAKNGVRFMVLIIPTKEMAYAGVASGYENISQEYKALIRSENGLNAKAQKFMRDNSIEFMDGTDILSHYLRSKNVLYSRSSDGHPNYIGYGYLAYGVYDYLQKKCL